MVKSWLTDGEIMVKWWWNDGEIMVKWWWNDGEIMVKSWWNHGEIMVKSWWNDGDMIVRKSNQKNISSLCNFCCEAHEQRFSSFAERLEAGVKISRSAVPGVNKKQDVETYRFPRKLSYKWIEWWLCLDFVVCLQGIFTIIHLNPSSAS